MSRISIDKLFILFVMLQASYAQALSCGGPDPTQFLLRCENGKCTNGLALKLELKSFCVRDPHLSDADGKSLDLINKVLATTSRHSVTGTVQIELPRACRAATDKPCAETKIKVVENLPGYRQKESEFRKNFLIDRALQLAFRWGPLPLVLMLGFISLVLIDRRGTSKLATIVARVFIVLNVFVAFTTAPVVGFAWSVAGPLFMDRVRFSAIPLLTIASAIYFLVRFRWKHRAKTQACHPE